jgi:hypothetical protein
VIWGKESYTRDCVTPGLVNRNIKVKIDTVGEKVIAQRIQNVLFHFELCVTVALGS